MVQDHVLNDLHAACVHGVDEILISRARRLQSWIDAIPIVAVVSVIIETTSILNRRGNPDCCEAQILNIV